MSSRVQASTIAPRALAPAAFTRIGVLVLAAVAISLVGCGEKKKDKAASQTAAKVNKEELTVHQINYVLSQQRGVPPAQAASAGRQVLERLIDQELAVQKAQEQKLDREPRVIQQLEAVRREVLARAYAERISSGATKPAPADIDAYYRAHPALFGERKLYSLQELQIEAKPDQIEALRTKLDGSKDIQDFVAFLKANDYKFAGNQAVRAAEQLPLASLDRLAAMKDGEHIFNTTPLGAQVIVVVSARPQAVDVARATPAIEQFLWNERKRKIVEEDLKALRAAAKVEYVGDYAGAAPAAAAPPAAASAPTAVPLEVVAPLAGPGAPASTVDNGITSLK